MIRRNCPSCDRVVSISPYQAGGAVECGWCRGEVSVLGPEPGRRSGMRRKECPNCGIVNPSQSRYCYCGYNFARRKVEPRPSGRPRWSRSFVLLRGLAQLLVSLAVTGGGVWLIVLRPNLVLRYTSIPFGYVAVVVGLVCLLACLSGVDRLTGKREEGRE